MGRRRRAQAKKVASVVFSAVLAFTLAMPANALAVVSTGGGDLQAVDSSQVNPNKGTGDGASADGQQSGQDAQGDSTTQAASAESQAQAGQPARASLMNLGAQSDPEYEGPYSGGSGTEEDPWRISTVEDLQEMAAKNHGYDGTSDYFNFEGEYFVLTKDIDLSPACGEVDGSPQNDANWVPIGNSQYCFFAGHFDGQGHTVSNLYINSTSGYSGLFGCIGVTSRFGATIENLTVTGEMRGNGAQYRGGIAGYVYASGSDLKTATIRNCANYVDVTGQSNLGGIVGMAAVGSLTIEGCVNYGDITPAYNNYNYGGIVGVLGQNQNPYNYTIENCANFGNIEGGYAQIGGIVGTIYDSQNGAMKIVRDCFNVGTIRDSNGNQRPAIVGNGTPASTRVYENNYYLNSGSDSVSYATPVDEATMRSPQFAKQVGGVFAHTPDSYPTPAWEGKSGAPTITAEPMAADYVQNSTATALKVEAEFPQEVEGRDDIAGTEGEHSFQWYVADSADYAAGEAIEDGTAATYTPSTAEIGEKWYYAIVTNTFDGKQAQAISDIVRIYVAESIAAAPQVSISAGGEYDYYAQATALKATVSNLSDLDAVSYQWYSNATNANTGGTPIAGEVNDTFLPPTSNPGTVYYYCQVTNTYQGASYAYATTDPVAVTTRDSFTIRTAEEMLGFATAVNSGVSYNGITVYLANDIDLSSVCGPEKGNWTPIGNYVYPNPQRPFSGTFDGQYHTVSGLYINEATTQQQALFGYLAGSASVKNLIVEGFVHSTANSVAGIVATANGSGVVLENLHNRATVTGPGGVGGVAGGVAGANVGSGRNVVRKCSNEGAISYGGSSWAQSIAGVLGSGQRVLAEDLYNTGSVTVQANSASSIAGVIGSVEGSTGNIYRNLYNAGVLDIPRSNSNGPVIGFGTDSRTTENMYYLKGSFDINKVYRPEWLDGSVDLPAPSTEVTAEWLAGQEALDALGESFVYGGVSPKFLWELGAFGLPLFTAHPAEGSADIGGASEPMTVAATAVDGFSGYGSFSYQWYSNSVNSIVGGTPIEGATSASYAVPTSASSSNYYYCEVTNSAGSGASLASMPAAFPVYSGNDVAAPVINESTPASAEYGFGAVPEALVVDASVEGAGAGTLSYQWYQSDDEVADPENDIRIDDATGTSYTPNVDAAGTKYYYCVVTNTFEMLKTKSTTSRVAKVTVSNEYIVRTAEDMYKLSDMSNNDYVTFEGVDILLANDIDMQEGVGEGEEPREWNGIGEFRGNFNGGGHRIDNIYSTDYYGLFYEITAPVTIENFVLTGEISCHSSVGGVTCSVRLQDAQEGEHVTFRNIGVELDATVNNYYGAIANTANGAVIENCYSIGNIVGVNFNGYGSFNGFNAGICYSGASVIRNCYHIGDISNGFTGARANQLYGITMSADVIENCYAVANFSAAAGNLSQAGIISNDVDAPVNCYYLNTTNAGILGGTAKTSEELQAAEMPGLLGDAFAYVEGSYPKLVWQIGPGAPIIKTHPQGASYLAPLPEELGALTVEAEKPAPTAIGGDGTLSYQWQSSSDNQTFADIAGATQASYIPPQTEGVTYYRCVVTNSFNDGETAVQRTVTSAVATVVVVEEAAMPVLDQSGMQDATCTTTGEVADLTIEASFADDDQGTKGQLAYQWFMNTENSTEGGTAIADATQASFKPLQSIAGTTYYYVEVYNMVEGIAVATAKSNVAAITVNPDYVINTPADLRAFVDSMATNSYAGGIVVLNNDIDLSTDEATQDWEMPTVTELGYLRYNGNPWLENDGGYVFKGTFDGQGHTISGLNIVSDKAVTGLFPGAINATIKNVSIAGSVTANPATGMQINGDSHRTGAMLLGVGMGYNSNENENAQLTIQNVSVDGQVVGGPTATVAGMAGMYLGQVKIEDCVNYANITTSNVGAGLVAKPTSAYLSDTQWPSSPSSRFTRVANHGNITVVDANSNYLEVSGIVGMANSARFIDCYNAGSFYIDDSVTGRVTVGGIAAGDSCYQLTNCFDYGMVYNEGSATVNANALARKANISPDYSGNIWVVEGGLPIPENGRDPRGEYVSAETMASDEFAERMGASFKKAGAYPMLAFETGAGYPDIMSQTTEGLGDIVQGEASSELSVTAQLPIEGLRGHDGTLSYQWYYQGAKGDPVAFGDNSATATPPTNIDPDYYKVWCEVTNTFDGGKTATTKSRNVSMHIVSTLDASEPYLTQQPTTTWYQQQTNTNIKADPPLKVSVYMPENDPTIGEISYQWYAAKTIEDYRNATGRAIANATTDTYQPYIAVVGTVYYYCIVTNTLEGGTVDGKVATTKSNVVKARTWSTAAATPTITAQPQGDVVYQQGDTAAELAVSAQHPLLPADVVGGLNDQKDGHASLSYQWYYNTTGTANPDVDTPVSRATEATYTPGTNISPDIYYYYCVVTNTFKADYPTSTQTATIVSDLAKVTIVSDVEAAQPVVQSNVVGGTYVNGEAAAPMSVAASFEDPAAAGAGELSYQWYASDDGELDPAGDTALANATQASLDLNTAMKPGDYKVYCAVTNTIEHGARADKVATVLSEAADVTIKGHEINDAADFKAFVDDVNSGKNYQGHYVVLNDDIDLSSICGPEKGNWVTIGNSWFNGSFDGQGHRISNLYYNGSSTYVALFRYTQGATIKNFVVDGSITTTSNQQIAGIVAEARTGTVIENVGNEIAISAAVGQSQSQHRVGGIVASAMGDSNSGPVIKNCYNAATIQDGSTWAGNANAYYYGVGGIVGQTQNMVSVVDCYNTGDVSGAYAGGIVGTHYSGNGTSITNCYSTGKITGYPETQTDIGGILGGLAQSSGSVRLVNTAYLEDQAPQGAVGREDGANAGVVSATDGAMKDASFAAAMGSAFKEGDIYPALVWQSDLGLPTITVQPVAGGHAVQNAKPEALSVEAQLPTGDKPGAKGTLSYQWFKANAPIASGGTAVTADSAEGAAYEPSTETLGTAYYYCVVTNTYPGSVGTKTTAVSQVVDFTTTSGTAAAVPSITAQPADAAYAQNDAAQALAVQASVADPGAGELTYQWFVSDVASNQDGTAIAGATEASFVPPTDKAGTKYYYCVVTDTFETYETATATSDAACVKVSGFQVSTAADLLALSRAVAAGNALEGVDVELTADIDLADVCGADKGNWVPIGASQSNPFKGSIEGNGHRVSNLYIDSADSYQGLVGYIQGGEVRNLVVTGSVKGAGYVGGVAGYGYGASFRNVRNEATVEASGNYAAGVVGYAGGNSSSDSVNIVGCANTAAVSANQFVGGITGGTGWGVPTTIDSCRNTGELTVASSNVGGIVGDFAYKGSMTNSYNAGATHVGESNVGGAIAANYNQADGCVLQGFYLSGTGTPQGSSATINLVERDDASMKDAAFADELGGAFKPGNTYPVLKWEADAGMPTIVSQPSNVAIMVGDDPVAMTVVAEAPEGGNAEALSYQWYADGQAVSNATSASYAPAATDQVGQTAYYCAVTYTDGETANTVNSETVTYAVTSQTEPATPQFLAQPQGASYDVGDTAAALSVEAVVSGAGAGELSYQWYSNNTGVADPSADALVVGATGTNMVPVTDKYSNTYYYCVATNTYEGAKTASVASDCALVVVNADIVIRTAEDLMAFRDAVNSGNTFQGKVAALENDIDLSAYLDGTSEWIPIGDSRSNGAVQFGGTFDGKGHTISGFNSFTAAPDNNSSHYGSLFGRVAYGATIQNFVLKGNLSIRNIYSAALIASSNGNSNGRISVKNVGLDIDFVRPTSGSLNYAGAFCSSASYTDFVGCYIKGNIVINVPGMAQYVAAFAGYASNCLIDSCYMVAHTNLKGSESWQGYSYEALFVSAGQNSTIVKNCYAACDNDNTNIYAVSSSASTDSSCTNNYFLEGTAVKDGSRGNPVTKSEEYMKSAEFVADLGDAYKFNPGGYPMLQWEYLAPTDLQEAGFAISAIDDVTYAGAAAEPEFTVAAGETVLTPGTDYTVAYENNEAPGTATVTVTGTGAYVGTLTASFQIRPASIEGATIEGLEDGRIADVPVTGDGTGARPAVTIKDANGTELVENVDYVVQIVDANGKVVDAVVAAGEYTAVISGTGGYYGTLGEAKFTAVERAPINDANVSMEAATYTGSALEPAVTVELGGKQLVQDTDFTVAYANNTNAGTATATIEGIGNYQGIMPVEFQILKATATVTVESATKDYGADDPELGYTVEGLQGSDQATAKVVREAGEDAGDYAVNATDVVILNNGTYVADNYDVTIVPGTLTINPTEQMQQDAAAIADAKAALEAVDTAKTAAGDEEALAAAKAAVAKYNALTDAQKAQVPAAMAQTFADVQDAVAKAEAAAAAAEADAAAQKAAEDAARAACEAAGVDYDATKTPAENIEAAMKASADGAGSEAAQKAAEDAARAACEAAGVAYDPAKTPAENMAAAETAARAACTAAGVAYDSAKTPAENMAAAQATARAACSAAGVAYDGKKTVAQNMEAAAKAACAASGIAYDASKTPAANMAAATDAKAQAASGKKDNTMKVKAKKVKAKAKKATKVKKAKAFKVTGAKGKVTFYKIQVKPKDKDKIKIAKGGKVTVKKGLKKGKTYKVKVLVVAKGNKDYAPAMKTVTLKVKVAKK